MPIAVVTTKGNGACLADVLIELTHPGPAPRTATTNKSDNGLAVQ